MDKNTLSDINKEQQGVERGFRFLKDLWWTLFSKIQRMKPHDGDDTMSASI